MPVRFSQHPAAAAADAGAETRAVFCRPLLRAVTTWKRGQRRGVRTDRPEDLTAQKPGRRRRAGDGESSHVPLPTVWRRWKTMTGHRLAKGVLRFMSTNGAMPTFK